MLLVLLRYCLELGPRTPPQGLVGLGPPEFAPDALRCENDDPAPGLITGVLFGLLGDGDR